MGLFDLFRRSPPHSVPETAEQPVQRRFERDPARCFDPQRAQRLAKLFALPCEQRDKDWRAQFWDAAWTAALVVPEPSAAIGPDGFPYVRLELPHEPLPYDANSLMNMAADLVR